MVEAGQSNPRRRYHDNEDHAPHSDEDDNDDDESLDETALMLGPADEAIRLVDRSQSQSQSRSHSRSNSRSQSQSSPKPRAEYADDDPLKIVSQAVPETDDPTLPALTWRAMIIGTFFCILGAAVSQLFFYKSNSPSFSAYFVVLASLPIGRWLARKLPDRTLYLGPFSIDLNPGPFSIKEHVLVAIISSSGATSAYASDIINIQELFYHQHMPYLASLTLLLTTQILGFGFAGLVNDLLVKPPAMLFPSTLVTTSLFHTLHDGKSSTNRPRLRLFVFAFVATFMYQFLPALIAPTLSSIAVLCLIDNRNSTFRILSSGYHGLGFLNISLDWNAAGMTGPLYQPWWAALNFYGGLACMVYIVTPILYFGFNLWDSQSFPEVLGSGLYTTNHTRFDIDSLLRPDNTLDTAKWESSKPMLLTPFWAITYGLSFATFTSMVTHVLIWHWKDIRKAITNPVHDDIHNRLMAAYDEVPRSWYAMTFGVTTVASCLLVITTPSLQLPIWALMLAILMGMIFIAPIGIMRAVSDTSVGLNVVSEFVIGYIMPGNPIGNILFKSMAYMSLAQALDLVTDLKNGHYLKIPPKHMFLAQLWGTAVGCVVNLAVVNIVLDPASGYRAFLDGTMEDPSGQWDGRKVRIFFSASVIWGLIGPSEFFGGKYHVLYYGFAVGAVLPLIPWWLHRRTRISALTKVAWPIIFHGAGAPPGVPTNVIMSGFFLSWLSQKHMREKHAKWFEMYNYVLSAALDAGASVNALVIFLLTISVLKWAPVPHWAGNPLQDAEHCKVATG